MWYVRVVKKLGEVVKSIQYFHFGCVGFFVLFTGLLAGCLEAVQFEGFQSDLFLSNDSAIQLSITGVPANVVMASPSPLPTASSLPVTGSYFGTTGSGQIVITVGPSASTQYSTSIYAETSPSNQGVTSAVDLTTGRSLTLSIPLSSQYTSPVCSFVGAHSFLGTCTTGSYGFSSSNIVSGGLKVQVAATKDGKSKTLSSTTISTTSLVVRQISNIMGSAVTDFPVATSVTNDIANLSAWAGGRLFLVATNSLGYSKLWEYSSTGLIQRTDSALDASDIGDDHTQPKKLVVMTAGGEDRIYYISDAGTASAYKRRVFEFKPSTNTARQISQTWNAANNDMADYLVPFKGNLLFFAADGISGNNKQLFTYVPDTAVTRLTVFDSQSGSIDTAPIPLGITKNAALQDNRFYFIATQYSGGYTARKLYYYEPAGVGIGQGCYVNALSSNDFDSTPNDFVQLSGNIFFTAGSVGTKGLYRCSDTTTTVEAVKIDYSGNTLNDVNGMILIGNKLYFSAKLLGVNLRKLFVYDPTTSSVAQVLDLHPAGHDLPDTISGPRFYDFDATIVYQGFSPSGFQKLFRYVPSSTGTPLIQQISDINGTASNDNQIQVMGQFNGSLIFSSLASAVIQLYSFKSSDFTTYQISNFTTGASSIRSMISASTGVGLFIGNNSTSLSKLIRLCDASYGCEPGY